MRAQDETRAAYEVGVDTASEDAVIDMALQIIRARMAQTGLQLNSPTVIKDYAVLTIGQLEHEVFCVAFLTAQLQMIDWQEMFRGTITQTAVYPREIVKAAMKANATAVVLAHNHPGGNVEPSRADRTLTTAIRDALALVDVQVLDHIIVGGGQTLSFAERGLL